MVEEIHRLVVGNFVPDLTFILDIPETVALEKLRNARESDVVGGKPPMQNVVVAHAEMRCDEVISRIQGG